MELKFDNKISEKQVLSKANKNKSPFELNYNGSMLFMGDNFEVLSILLIRHSILIKNFLFQKMEELIQSVIQKTI